MSAQFSPDGMYYWDGTRWISTLSPDGRYRWNGSSWEAMGWQGRAPVRYEPTSWTQPLQYAVAGWYAISSLFSLTLPFWFAGQMSQMMNAAFQRQRERNPDLAPPPPGLIDTMTSVMEVAIGIGLVIGLAICVVIIVGALKRWTWMYYAVLALLGLGVISSPLSLLNFATGAYSSSYSYTPPTALYVIGIVSWFPSTALFAWMLIALIKRGPWGMVKVTAEGRPAA